MIVDVGVVVCKLAVGEALETFVEDNLLSFVHELDVMLVKIDVFEKIVFV